MEKRDFFHSQQQNINCESSENSTSQSENIPSSKFPNNLLEETEKELDELHSLNQLNRFLIVHRDLEQFRQEKTLDFPLNTDSMPSFTHSDSDRQLSPTEQKKQIKQSDQAQKTAANISSSESKSANNESRNTENFAFSEKKTCQKPQASRETSVKIPLTIEIGERRISWDDLEQLMPGDIFPFFEKKAEESNQEHQKKQGKNDKTNTIKNNEKKAIESPEEKTDKETNEQNIRPALPVRLLVNRRLIAFGELLQSGKRLSIRITQKNFNSFDNNQ